MQQTELEGEDWTILCKAGGIAAFLLWVYSIATMAALITVGGQPPSAQEAFAVLQKNRLIGLLRLDALTLIIMPAYYVLFAGLYMALRRTNRVYATVAAALAFVGVTLFLSTPSVLSMAYLADQHAAATNELRRNQLVAAGEGIIASDMWHSTAAVLGGMLLQTGCVLISLIMLQGRVFSKTTAYVGVLLHGLDLAHLLVGLIVPLAGLILMAVAGPLYLIWFPLVGRRLYSLRGDKPIAISQTA